MPLKTIKMAAADWRHHPWLSEHGFAVLTGIAVGLLVVSTKAPFQVLVVLLGLACALAIMARIEFGLFFLILITFTNFSSVAIEYYNAPSVAKILIILLALGILTRQVFAHKDMPTNLRPLSLALGLYALAGFVSLLFAPEAEPGLLTMWNYLKDSFLALLIVFIVRQGNQLRLASWAILLGGAFLGSIGVFQHLTGTFENPYWGFSQAHSQHIVDLTEAYRISGPIGGPNYFAQFLLVVLPLATERIFVARRIIVRLFAAYTLVVSLLALVYTYSRGGLVALAIMVLLFFCLQPRRSWIFVLLALAALPLLQLVPSQYFSRMNTLQAVMQGKRQALVTEVSFRGRLSEMIVAYRMFADHPLRGIGLGNYEHHYQKYAQKVFLDTRQEERNAHCRYLEILAETGLVGFSAFCFLLWLMYRGIQRAYQQLRLGGESELAHLVLAFALSMTGFLAAYLFLHDAYPRFFWILAGILFAIPNVIANECTGVHGRKACGSDDPHADDRLAESKAGVEGKTIEFGIPIAADADSFQFKG